MATLQCFLLHTALPIGGGFHNRDPYYLLSILSPCVDVNVLHFGRLGS
jgi:hypothetical protein